jgi:hypothetical protein
LLIAFKGCFKWLQTVSCVERAHKLAMRQLLIYEP